MKSALFCILCLFSLFEAQANKLVLVTKVLSQEVVKIGVGSKQAARLKPFNLEQSNACVIQFVKLYVESVLYGNFHEQVIDTHVILGEWCGQPFKPFQEYVVKLFDKEDSIVSIHRTQLDGWETFNVYSINKLSNDERALTGEGEIRHFDHFVPSVISEFNGKQVIRIKDLKAWYAVHKSSDTD